MGGFGGYSSLYNRIGNAAGTVAGAAGAVNDAAQSGQSPLGSGSFGGLTNSITSAVGNLLGTNSATTAATSQPSGGYSANVERWRAVIERIFREVGGNQFTPADVDKALYVIMYESGGDPTIMGDGGHAVGLFQLNDGGLASGRSLEALKDAEANIRVAAEAIYGGQGWGPWGENRLYQGKPFGALGNHPYQGYTDAQGNPVQGPTSTQSQGTGGQLPDMDRYGMPAMTYMDFLTAAGGDLFEANLQWAEYQKTKSQVRNQGITEVMGYLEQIGNEIALDIQNRNLSLNQAMGEFEKRLSQFTAGQQALTNIIPFTIPRDATGALFGFGPGGIGQTLGMSPPQPVATVPNPLAMANQLTAGIPDYRSIGTANLSSYAGTSELLLQAMQLARTPNNGLQSWPPPGGPYPGSMGPDWVGRGAG